MTDALRERWGLGALESHLQALEPGLALEIVDAIDSTNTALLTRAGLQRSINAQGAAGKDLRGAPPHGPLGRPFPPCLLVAEHQTQGRGRQGRAWHASPGASLTFSLALLLAPQDWSGLSLAVGVALAEALDPAPALTPDAPGLAAGGALRPAGPRIGLKWPNDLWLRDPAAPGGGRKLGGVLIETSAWTQQAAGADALAASRPTRTAAPAARVCVIGVGLNLQPQTVTGASSGVACLQEMHTGATAPAVLAWVAPALLAGVRRFEREGFASVAPAFARRDLLRDQAVSTTLPNLPAGTAEGVDDSGALRVRTADGRLHPVVGGEVSVRLLSGRS